MQSHHDDSTILRCMQPSLFKRVFELRREDHVEATLQYASWPPGAASMESASGKWEFRRLHWYKADIGIWQPGFELPFAKYTANPFGRKGVVELPMGERLQYERRHWRGIHTLINDVQRPVLRCTVRKTLRDRGDLAILPDGVETVKKYPWLPVFLYYLVAGQQQGAH